MVKLSARMAAVAAMVPSGSNLADIGTDHAYLPIYLVSEGLVPFAVAGDIHYGPYLSALDSVRRWQLTAAIDVRQGDGLAVLTPGEVDTVVLAGMGGPGIIEILARQADITQSLSRLIIQPMLATGAVRRWLMRNGWRLVDETLVEEDRKIYEIVAAEQGESPQLPDILYEIGPLLWERRHPLLKTHLALLITQAKRVVAQMAASPRAAASSKYQEYSKRIDQLEEKYACL